MNSFLYRVSVSVVVTVRKKYVTIVILSTHHDQGLQYWVSWGGELLHVRQEDVERERKPNDKDHENDQYFDESVQDIMENCDVFSNPRKLPREITS